MTRKTITIAGIVSLTLLLSVFFVISPVAADNTSESKTIQSTTEQGTVETYELNTISNSGSVTSNSNVYRIPFVENTQKLSSAYHSRVAVSSRFDNTTVKIDGDADGNSETVDTLSAGDSKSVSNPSAGSLVEASNPVNVSYSYGAADYGAYEDGDQKYGVPEESLLGTEYYIPLNADRVSIMSTTATNVRIDTDGDGATDQTQTLSKNQVVDVSSITSGTHITSDQPIHVVAEKSDWNNMDNTYLVSLLPVSSAKKNYVIPSEPSYSRNNPNSVTHVDVVGTEAGTTVETNGRTSDIATTLDTGEVYSIDADSSVSSNSFNVTADKPVVAVYSYHVIATDPWTSDRRDYIGVTTPVSDIKVDQGSWSGTSEKVDIWSTYQISQPVQPSAGNFRVSNITPSGVNVTQADSIDVGVDLTNVGGQASTQTVQLRLDTDTNGALESDEVVRNRSMSLDAGDSTRVSFTNISMTGLNTGTHNYGIFSSNNNVNGSLNIEPASLNGHKYEFVDKSIRWENARVAASNQKYNSKQGYLATVTSEQEQKIINSLTNQTAWIGASDKANEGTWRWVTGPEGKESNGQGRQFYQGDETGSVVKGEYANWSSGEPNNANGNEYYAHLWSDGSWNDESRYRDRSGYIVEYGNQSPSLQNNFTTVTGVDGTNFSTIKSYVNVDTAAARNGTLSKSDFSVTENGVQQPIQSVNYVGSSNGSAGSGTPTDIVFTIDATGSMGNEIDAVRREAKNLSTRLSNSGRDVRFGLVTFSNSQIQVEQNLTRNVSELERSLDSVGVGGGTEYNYDALDTALGMNYRSNAQKVVIDITDEDADLGSKTQQDISQAIQQRGISYIAVSPDFGHGAATTTSGTATVTDESGASISSTSKDLDKAVLASKTGGQWYDIAQPDFSNVLTNVTSSLSSTYVVTHESTIPRANATNRTVEVTVDDPNAGVSSDTGQYSVQPQSDFVTVTGVDGSNFSTVTSYVNVNTAAARNGTLSKSDFSVGENGVQQPIQSVNYVGSSNGSGAGTPTDIVFTIDATGSMGDEIDTVRREAKNLSNRLSNSGRDVRFGLVTFANSRIQVEQNLTRNVSELERSLDSVNVGGGTEYNYDALDTALGMNYRSNAQKVLIDITDEDADRGSKTQQDISQEIQQRGISYIAVSPDFGHGAATTTGTTATVTDESGATISSTPEDLDKAVLASKTGGQWYDIAQPDFSNVLTNVTSSLSSTYVVKHESTIPRANATNRTVEVTVDDPNAGVSSDTGQYSVPGDFVEVTGVDGTNFSTIKSYVNVDTAAGRNGTLTQSDFSVAENGNQQPITSVRAVGSSNGSGAGTPTDIVFTIDATGSMGNEIDTVRREAKNLSTRLSNSGRDVRFGLVTFSNSQIQVEQNLTRNVSELERSLDSVGASGGTEYNYDALDTALGMNYRSNAQKVLIDITDEDADRGQKTQQDIAQEMQQRGISYIAVSPDFGHGAASTTGTTATVTDESGASISTTDKDLDKAVLASETGGQWYDIAQPDFSNVLTNVTSSLSSTYVVKHESTIPRANASNRTVEVTVDDPNAGVSSDTGSYAVSPPSQPQPTSAQVKLSPNKKTVAVGDTTTYDIVVTETQSQIGAYNYTVNTRNVSNATITDFAFAGSPITKSVSFASDNSSVTADATQASVPSGTDVIIGTVTVKAESVGSTNLSVGVNDIVDTRGNPIPINKTLDSSLAISQGTSQTLRFDPATQAVAPGTTTTFDLIVPNASSGISAYDYTIRTNDSATANITAVQPGGSPASSTLNVDYAPDNSSVAVTGGFAKIAPGTNVSIGTVTVSGAANGTAELSARVGPVIDANNSAVAIAGAERATVEVNGSRVSAPGDLTGNGQAATDPDNDGVYEDINGDGSADLRDLQPFFDLVRPSASTPQTPALDMNGDGQVGLRDLQPFFNEVRP